jgi:hypothetical protein
MPSGLLHVPTCVGCAEDRLDLRSRNSSNVLRASPLLVPFSRRIVAVSRNVVSVFTSVGAMNSAAARNALMRPTRTCRSRSAVVGSWTLVTPTARK